MKQKKSVLLVRISTQEICTPVYSIAGQIIQLKKYAANHGHSIAAQIANTNTTSTGGERPMVKLEAFLRTHPDVRIVLMLTSASLSRKCTDYFGLENLVNELDLEVHIVRDNIILRKVASGQDCVAQSIFGNYIESRNSIENLRERVIKGQRTKAERGEYPGWPPFGYRMDHEHQAIIEEPFEASIVKELPSR
jgi:DNA invertase Pin-like site-specific DNA recombinase